MRFLVGATPDTYMNAGEKEEDDINYESGDIRDNTDCESHCD